MAQLPFETNTYGRPKVEPLDQRQQDYLLNESWPAKAILAAISGAKLPGDVAAGRVDPLSDEAIARGVDAASLGVGAAATQRPAFDSLNMFLGMKAKKAPMADIDKFRNRELGFPKQEGGRKQAWQELGVGRAISDGMIRWELSDAEAQLKGIPMNAMPLKNVLDHPEFFENYPQTEYLEIRPYGGKDSLGYFDDSGVIGLNARQSKDSMLSTLLHEVQHKVQHEERFRRGSNPKREQNDIEAVSIMALNDILQGVKGGALDADSAFRQMRPVMEAVDRSPYLGVEQYMKTPGEIEARAVQDRQYMSDPERFDLYPGSVLDVQKEIFDPRKTPVNYKPHVDADRPFRIDDETWRLIEAAMKGRA